MDYAGGARLSGGLAALVELDGGALGLGFDTCVLSGLDQPGLHHFLGFLISRQQQ